MHDQAIAIRNLFLSEIVSSHTVTRMLIQNIPADKLNFQLEPDGETLADLAWYNLAVHHVFLSGLCDGRFPELPPKPEGSSTAAFLAWDDNHFAADYDRFAQLSAADLTSPIEFRGVEKPAIEYLPAYLSNSTHHRALLSVYLRISGALTDAIDALESQAASNDGELTQAELAAAAGGTGNGVTTTSSTGGPIITVNYSNQTATQMGWIAPPQTQATLMNLFGDPQTNRLGFGAVLGGGALGLSATILLDAFLVMSRF